MRGILILAAIVFIALFFSSCSPEYDQVIIANSAKDYAPYEMIFYSGKNHSEDDNSHRIIMQDSEEDILNAQKSDLSDNVLSSDQESSSSDSEQAATISDTAVASPMTMKDRILFQYRHGYLIDITSLNIENCRENIILLERNLSKAYDDLEFYNDNLKSEKERLRN